MDISETKEIQEKQFICIDPKCDQSNRLFKSKNENHPHKSHDHQLYSEFQKLIRAQFPQQIREQINQQFSKDELIKAIQTRSVQMHESVKNFEENLIKTIEAYDILGADKASINQALSQLNEQNPPQQLNIQGLMHVLKFNKLGPQKVLEKWKRENEIILKELSTQADAALKTLGNVTISSYMHIQHLQSPLLLQKMNYVWSKSLKANSVTIREDATYEKGNSMGLVCIQQVLEKDQVQSLTIDIKERAGNLYIGVLDMNERKQRGRKTFSFHDWNESGHGLYLLYHGGYVFSSNDLSINSKKAGFTFDQNDKIILTWNGPEHSVTILKVGSSHQFTFKVNPDGQYHFAAGLFKCEIRLLD
ncbi:unnamed protein product [Paramecium sonneborni]|uniref:Uncharacterized protein n=1 Tax=Paramecium sonneborni TaxID=65129 RepID=A0A8S1NMR3_9CILI|nr:unnamed protein product [Paramecium sonneborni]